MTQGRYGNGPQERLHTVSVFHEEVSEFSTTAWKNVYIADKVLQDFTLEMKIRLGVVPSYELCSFVGFCTVLVEIYLVRHRANIVLGLWCIEKMREKIFLASSVNLNALASLSRLVGKKSSELMNLKPQDSTNLPRIGKNLVPVLA